MSGKYDINYSSAIECVAEGGVQWGPVDDSLELHSCAASSFHRDRRSLNLITKMHYTLYVQDTLARCPAAKTSVSHVTYDDTQHTAIQFVGLR